jgi:inhibitor of cysteine peptidase
MDRAVSLSAVQLAGIVVVALLVGGVGAAMLDDVAPSDQSDTEPNDSAAVETFDSAEEFRAYLREGNRRRAHVALGAASGGDGAQRSVEEGTDDAPRSTPGAEPAATEVAGEADDSGGEGGDRRASDTNVQIGGIDEPDILKTTSETVYYSPPNRRPRIVHDEDGDERRVAPDDGVRLINATDPAAPEVANRLNVSGQLLLANDTLVVFDGDTIVGYDVADRANPEQAWSTNLSSRVVTARLYGGHVYLVTESRVDAREPCPIEPLGDVTVPCTDIHHPSDPVPVDSTYTVTAFDPADGSVSDTASFVGSGGRSVVHVSPGTVYVTYPRPVDRAEMLAEFLVTNQSDRLDADTIARIEEIRSYDLSPRAKRIEIRRAIETWLTSLDEEERREAQRALREDMQAWAADNKRDFEQTGIVAFDIGGADTDSPTVEAGATGTVPGQPLNQFSLDERDGRLRIATTVGGAMGTDSENDLYVLDESLEETGSVQGMGITERIYSVRYVGDEAYIVTFRRIDPFHVVDLSDPENPTVEGELKLPGFSSYLHPLSEDRVLGIGEEDGQVKLVVFDVSDPGNPTIENDRILDARWSAVSEDHHAFLMDRRHGVFFLPAGGEAYVFDYENGSLDVETTVETDGRVHRTAYVGDYLYVFGDASLTVVDERTWTETSTVEFAEDE